MDNRTLARVIDILETDPDFFVPVKKLWLMLQGEGLALDIDLQGFRTELLADARFEFTTGVDHGDTEETPELAKDMQQDMEALGFFSGPRVKLVSREMTVEDVFAGLARSVARMNEALQGAWETRPEGDRETEDQLLEILAAGQKLEEEIEDIVEQHSQEPQVKPAPDKTDAK